MIKRLNLSAICIATITCALLSFFAPIKNGEYNFPEYLNFLFTSIYVIIFFTPVITSALISGSFHYLNPIGFYIGVVVEAIIVGLVVARFLDRRRQRKKEK